MQCYYYVLVSWESMRAHFIYRISIQILWMFDSYLHAWFLFNLSIEFFNEYWYRHQRLYVLDISFCESFDVVILGVFHFGSVLWIFFLYRWANRLVAVASSRRKQIIPFFHSLSAFDFSCFCPFSVYQLNANASDKTLSMSVLVIKWKVNCTLMCQQKQTQPRQSKLSANQCSLYHID